MSGEEDDYDGPGELEEYILDYVDLDENDEISE